MHAAPVLCAAADALAVDDPLTDPFEVRDALADADADAEEDADTDADDERDTELEVRDETCVERETEPADEVRERMKVGVMRVEGTFWVSVGMTRALEPKNGASDGLNIGPVSVHQYQQACFFLLTQYGLGDERRTARRLRNRSCYQPKPDKDCSHHDHSITLGLA